MAVISAGSRKPATRASKPRKSYGQLSQRSRDRIAVEGAKFGLTRKQSRERYNRGTFNPLSPDPTKKTPRNPVKHPPIDMTVLDIDTLRDQARKRIEKLVGDRIGFNRANLVDALERTEDRQVLYRLMMATEEELEDWATLQPQRRKKDLRKLQSQGMVWYDSEGKARSFWWYH